MPGIAMYLKYDRDGDGVLTLEEFEPLAHKFLEINVRLKVHLHDHAFT